MIFSSPQAITDHKIDTIFLNDIITFYHNRSCHCLTSLIIDEPHLFVPFGMYFFCTEFLRLKTTIIDRLKVKNHPNQFCTHCPILFMMTTCTKEIVCNIELMTGFSFLKPENIFWLKAIKMQRQTSLIHTSITTHVQNVVNIIVGICPM